MSGVLPYDSPLITAGCDEAGRGSLAGPVFAAAVILPPEYHHEQIDDSKQLSSARRSMLAEVIRREALAWGIGRAEADEIDRINILQASFLAMHRALDALSVEPQLIIVDGNRFRSYRQVPHYCFVKGDSRFLPIAAASILAKTARDTFMAELHSEYPHYGWSSNKGYPSPEHIRALLEIGPTPYHRKTFHVKRQLKMPFN